MPIEYMVAIIVAGSIGYLLMIGVTDAILGRITEFRPDDRALISVIWPLVWFIIGVIEVLKLGNRLGSRRKPKLPKAKIHNE